MYAPQFIVTSKGIAKIPSSVNPYTDSKDDSIGHKVSLTHGFFANQSVQIYFPTNEEADQFGKWQVYTPQDILERMGSKQAAFTVSSIERIKQKGPTNQYTDRAETVDVWRASLKSEVEGRAIDWIYPSESQARVGFGRKSTYTVIDMFGTMQSVPQVVAASYEYAAEQALQKEKDLEDAKYRLNLNRQNAADVAAGVASANMVAADRARMKEIGEASASYAAYLQAKREADELRPIGPLNTPEEIAAFARLKQAANARADAMGSAASNEESESRSAQAQYNAAVLASRQANEAARQATIAVQQRTIPVGIQTYTITAGGAPGLYNGVYYTAGTFKPSSQPVSWEGIFEPR